jgi:hypothetical protein
MMKRNVARGSGRVLSMAFAIMALAPTSRALAQDGTAAAVTFSKDVAPIFYRSCIGCHRSGQAAPMSLVTFEDARPWARSIRMRVSNREMPPWHLDPTVGIKEYANDRSLPEEDIATIVAWVDGGAPQGNPADLPELPVLTDSYEWSLGEPDLVLTTAEEFNVPAVGPDSFIYFNAVPTGLTEDRYIKAIDMRGSLEGGRTVHHGNAIAIQDEEPGYNGRADNMRPDRAAWVGTYLMNYNPGMSANILPEGTGQLLRAGARVAMDAHYHPVGEAVADRLSVALYFYPKGYVPKHRIMTAIVSPKRDGSGTSLDIPAGADNVRHDGYFTLPQPAKILAFQPHMHYRGKAMSLEAILPDGSSRLLTSVSDYDFNWQVSYIYKDPPALPAGTVLHTISYHDNSTANRHNPDPTTWVGSGMRTADEMANGWTDFVYISDEEYQEIASRQSREMN